MYDMYNIRLHDSTMISTIRPPSPIACSARPSETTRREVQPLHGAGSDTGFHAPAAGFPGVLPPCEGVAPWLIACSGVAAFTGAVAAAATCANGLYSASRCAQLCGGGILRGSRRCQNGTRDE